MRFFGNAEIHQSGADNGANHHPLIGGKKLRVEIYVSGDDIFASFMAMPRGARYSRDESAHPRDEGVHDFGTVRLTKGELVLAESQVARLRREQGMLEECDNLQKRLDELRISLGLPTEIEELEKRRNRVLTEVQALETKLQALGTSVKLAGGK